MQGAGRDAAQQATETLQLGASRPESSEVGPTSRRRLVAVGVAFLVGAAVGGAALLWWQARPSPPVAFHGDEHAVELVLFAAAPPGSGAGRAASQVDPLHVDGGLLLSGSVTSTVLRISTPGRSLDVRVPALPVTVSPTARYQSVELRLVVRDCRAASRWALDVDRPFTIAWRDEDGRVHLDRAGDFDRSLAIPLVRYVDSVCDNRAGG